MLRQTVDDLQLFREELRTSDAHCASGVEWCKATSSASSTRGKTSTDNIRTLEVAFKRLTRESTSKSWFSCSGWNTSWTQ